MNAPLDPPAPAPLPEPLPEPPPDLLDGDAHGSPWAGELEVAVGAAELLGDTDELAEAVGAGVVAPALSARERDMPCRMSKPLEEAEAVGEAADDGEPDGDPDEAGTKPFVRSQSTDCSEGEDPAGDPLGVGEAAWEPGPEPESATATAAGVSITAAATADSPIVSRFIAVPSTCHAGHRNVPRSPTRAPEQKTAR